MSKRYFEPLELSTRSSAPLPRCWRRPDVVDADRASPLYVRCVFVRRASWERIQERLECISVLLEAGASVNLMAG